MGRERKGVVWVRCHLIVNPHAKRGRASSWARRVQRWLEDAGWECVRRESRSSLHVRGLTEEALRDGADAVVLFGGDGTIHQAVQVLAGTDVPLGLIPCGRGNDLARALSLPLTTEEAAAVILRGKTKRIDLGVLDGNRYFCGILTCGFDSEVAAFARRYPHIPGGWLGYFVVALLLLALYRFRSVRVKGDGFSFSGEVLLVATANCPAYGGGMWIAPVARLDDGLLHVCIVRRTGKWRIVRLLPTVFSGCHVNEPEVSLHPTRRLLLDADEPLPLFADGEPVGTTPMEVTIAPNALCVFAP